MCSACEYVYLLLLSTFTEPCHLVANVVGIVCMHNTYIRNYIIAVQANWTLWIQMYVATTGDNMNSSVTSSCMW